MVVVLPCGYRNALFFVEGFGKPERWLEGYWCKLKVFLQKSLDTGRSDTSIMEVGAAFILISLLLVMTPSKDMNLSLCEL